MASSRACAATIVCSCSVGDILTLGQAEAGGDVRGDRYGSAIGRVHREAFAAGLPFDVGDP